MVREIVLCERLEGYDTCPDDIIHMEHEGVDSVFILDQMPAGAKQESRLIKLIKNVASRSDLPMYVYQHYSRLEDVKKILYAGAAGTVMGAVAGADFRLIKEAVSRFGKDKIWVGIPDTQPISPALIGAIKDTGVGGCVVAANRTAVEMFDDFRLNVIWVKPFETVSEAMDALSVEGIVGICGVHGITDKKLDIMTLKAELKDKGLDVNCFESKLAFSDFKCNSDGLIPVITQDYKTGEVLMLAYMNEASFNETVRSGRMTYFSRSRQELWKKGETSGHYQYVKSMDIDCDKDTLLAKVVQIGAACHTGHRSCFYTNLMKKAYDDTNPATILEQVMGTIEERKRHPKEGSYTNYLFDQGIDKILKKVGEEATEIVIAAKNPDSDELKYEICDFLYHMMVLMSERDVSWKEITKELAARH
ncbi:MAG TPA: bifunctional phosphoribosyl-AMP cyclohydrolase/phosphoribosyl-ATP diphosphatase HisIE [Candidatus Onthocola gallistercoris]|uniref:Histidine biosynthesis bifunctional protein HisIE n=1 Tax=Candidatus Onthocola gallistercoris TaxID=2840876 RepID=A0A9D1HGE4_9FIRM|nr:bifunctional phosphoribosyl-AMP cyclohydrolase/phosphoribosyl-ATP diphosphatase HisIE [Candidatus Onthocola gallistercoris]